MTVSSLIFTQLTVNAVLVIIVCVPKITRLEESLTHNPGSTGMLVLAVLSVYLLWFHSVCEKSSDFSGTEELITSKSNSNMRTLGQQI